MKKASFKSLICLLALLVFLSSCGLSAEEEEEDGGFDPTMNVMLVLDEEGFGDNSYNDLCWAGLERARDELNVEISYIRAGDQDHYADAITSAVNSEVVLIICADPSMAEALTVLAAQYPAQAFAIIDTDLDCGNNVTSISFNAEEGSFLAGIIAGLTSKNHVVSFIGGKSSDAAQNRYLYGFEAGVSTANRNTQIGVGWVNSYTDSAAAKKIAVAHGALFSDVMFEAVGNAGEGVVSAGRERGFSVIYAGKDGDYLNGELVSEEAGDELNDDSKDEAPFEPVLCSLVKKADLAIFEVVESYIQGSFYENGDVVYTLANGGVDISDPRGHIPPAVMAIVNNYKSQIIDGSLEIPDNWVSWYNYVNSLPEQ